MKVPTEMLPRFVPLADGHTFVPLEELIAKHLDQLFPGMEIVDTAVFRVTRDADFTVSDEADDLLQAVEDELRRRRFGEVVRVEVEAGMSREMREQLERALEAEHEDVFEIDGLLDLNDLWEIVKVPGFSELRDEPWTPVTQPRLLAQESEDPNVIAAIREGDILLHHPYDSFSTSIERLVEEAVADPDVLAIKQTLYRTGDDSPLVPALIRAAERGKQAVCLVELKARFDERANIHLGEHAGGGRRARRLRPAGAQDPREVRPHRPPRARRRAQLRPRRHRQLPPDDGAPVHRLRAAHLRRRASAPTSSTCSTSSPASRARAATARCSWRPPTCATGSWPRSSARSRRTREGKHARIALKMNSLVDRRCIHALYAASQAGVPVDLNIRGICCLRPGVPGVSENIRVVSIVGRFLEHSRIFAFERDRTRTVYIGSADLMPRNLDTRVELLAPVRDESLRGDLLDTLERCFTDDTNAWELGQDGSWTRRTPQGPEPRNVQRELMTGHLARAPEPTASHGLSAPDRLAPCTARRRRSARRTPSLPSRPRRPSRAIPRPPSARSSAAPATARWRASSVRSCAKRASAP